MVRIRHLAWCATGPVLLGAALSAAPPAGAAVADPLVLGTCVAAVQGNPGQPVALSPGALIRPITDALAPLDPLGVLRPQLTAAWTTLPPLPIGAVSADPASISGNAIGNVVVRQLGSISAVSPVLALLTGPVRAVLSDVCGVATQPALHSGMSTPQPVASPGASPITSPRNSAPRNSAPRTHASDGSPQSPGRRPAATSGDDAIHGGGIAGGAAPDRVAGNGVPIPAVPPEGVITLSNQPPPPYNLPGVSPEGVITLSNQAPPPYSLPALPSPSGVTQPDAGSAQPGNGSDAGTARLREAGEVTGNKLRLLPAFAALLLALALSQLARSWALRSPRRRPGAHVP